MSRPFGAAPLRGSSASDRPRRGRGGARGQDRPRRGRRRRGGLRRELHGLHRPDGASDGEGGGVSLTVVVVHPDLLGTYGDGGNGLVLTQRARWRGIDAELVEARSDRVLPAGDLYCLG